MEIKFNKITIGLPILLLIYVVTFLYMPLTSNCALLGGEWHSTYNLELYISTAAIFFLLVVLRLAKKLGNREFLVPLVLVIIFVFFINVFYLPSSVIAACSGTVLDDNWWAALNWIKNNTAECSVVATYWDPGHFITGIAKRSVVFDGATQGATRTVAANENLTGTIIEKADNGINNIKIYENGTVTTARIQDIATTLFTSNETLAVNILRDYEKPNCTEFYYIASADLIGKSQWWTYFATWNPLNAPTFGQRYNYAILSLSSARPILEQNSIAYYYNIGQNTAFVIYEANNTLTPYFQQQNQLAGVEKLYYFDKQGNGKLFVNENADLKGLLWLDPSRQTLVFMPPELEASLFTRMFFFNGLGLQKFELVNVWGGEIKLFKVKLD